MTRVSSRSVRIGTSVVSLVFKTRLRHRRSQGAGRRPWGLEISAAVDQMGWRTKSPEAGKRLAVKKAKWCRTQTLTPG